ncbi:glycosyltransferase [Cellulomonas phragmiteti]|uniref:Glycosyl transferase n=1 Tax=Cellulomonas phragmiteti TaxID=478780 RepID=A0ABQ4DN46_9CELL|nr:nucleotide disphospho-sugar-binding domain-containing protein [Cellulomonas phragmiteti]GIG40768.1 glycosyl transferase [Cellulomonas phragmiteti]
MRPTTVVAACPVHAHVTPLLAVARALVDAGHRVRFLTGARFRAEVESTGAELVPLPPDAGFDERTLEADHPERAGRTGIGLLRWDLEHLFVGRIGAQVAALDAVLDPTVGTLVFEPLLLGAYAVTSRPRAHRPRTVAVSIFPSAARHPGVPPFGPGLTPLPGVRGRVRDALVRVAVEQVALRPAQVAARRAVRDAGGRPPSGFLFGWTHSADVTVQLTVPGFEYPRPGLGDAFRLVGPAGVPRPGSVDVDPGTLPPWWGDLDGRTVVHVTQGTVANDDVGQLLRPTVDALAEEDVLVVAATGGTPVERLGPLPANVRAARMVPYAALLPRTDVMVTNGGYGGVHWALAHGVPLVVAGATEDKAEVGARVAWSGVGVRLRGNRPTPDQVRDAVREVRTDPSYRAAAQRLAEQVAAAPGLPGVVEAVEGTTRTGAGDPPRPAVGGGR